MSWFARIIAHHPYVVLIAIGVFSITCLVIPLTTIKLPNFKDPQLGFEARGTEIGQRITAWDNLLQATRPSGQLTVNPTLPAQGSSKSVDSKSSVVSIKIGNNMTSPLNEISPAKYQPPHNISLVVAPEIHRNYSDDSDEDWGILKTEFEEDHSSYHQHDHLCTDAYFCSQPRNDYGRLVISSRDGTDLFSLDSVKAMCVLEQYLLTRPEFPSLCETISKGRCCRPWSLVNYLVMLNNKTSCFNITKEDIESTRNLLEYCHHYYFDLHHLPDYSKRDIPVQCRRHNTVYNMMHYILDYEFKDRSTPLLNLMILLPIARSTAALDYYYSLESIELSHKNVVVTAIDFGLKSTLFDECLVRDTRLIALGAGFVFISMWLYTGSIFVTLMTLIAIAFSLGISYFIYTLILELKFFPFMNLLASIVAVGVGGDAGMMVCKVWSCAKSEDAHISLTKLVLTSHNHSALCMLVSSLTTAAAFYSSYISNVTAICCFSVFAGTAVVANFIVMVAWVPATLVISEKLPNWLPPLEPLLAGWCQSFRNLLIASVVKLKALWLVLLGSLAIASMFAVLYYPKLRLPDTPDLQLFRTNHPFEQYDLFYRNRFWFERLQMVDIWNNPNVRLPLRFVWGVLPQDTGDYLDPTSRGKLQLDPTFDLADPESQTWLLNFCTQLRAQPFYQSTMGPLLPNCFLEAFVEWMKRRCSDPIHPELGRAPCCESAQFPYSRRVFATCLSRAAASLYTTPAQLSMPGVAGPKFSKQPAKSGLPKLKALVVEYDSNFTHTTSFLEMDSFFRQVENWSRKEFLRAPAGMRNGWFVSQLELYDLQKSLQDDTVAAIAVSLSVAFIVVLLTTLNPLLSLFAIANITSTIFVTIAILILLGWRLNVLEAVAVSVAIGLAVDFSIHYVINYKMAPEKEKREGAVIYSLSMMGGPTLMAAMTTGLAGALMLPSQVLAYTQIGVFLLVVMTVSWLYSTMFLMSALAYAGPQATSNRWWGTLKRNEEKEQHELGRMGRRRRRLNKASADRSPSAASATTIIHDDDITTAEIAVLSIEPS